MLSIEVARPVEDQAALVMLWRNDQETLAQSYHHRAKTWDTFWPEFVRDYFADVELLPIFVKDDKDRIAFLRFNLANHPSGSTRRCCDISINVDPQKRAMGYGVSSLKIATQFLRARGIDDILAEIRIENLASINAFEKANFRRIDQVIKHVEDTGEKCTIFRYLREASPPLNRALLIDLDGTLADSISLMKTVYHRFLAEFGAYGKDSEFDALNGPSLNEVVKSLKAHHGLSGSVEELSSRYLSLVKDAYLNVTPNIGAEDLLAHAVAHGWLCLVVTSNSEAIAREWLIKTNLSKFIYDVVGKESVRVGKPTPEPYLVALQRAGCSAKSAIAVEDSFAGALSASNAGIQTFAYLQTDDLRSGTLPAGCRLLKHLEDLQPWIRNA